MLPASILPYPSSASTLLLHACAAMAFGVGLYSNIISAVKSINQYYWMSLVIFVLAAILWTIPEVVK